MAHERHLMASNLLARMMITALFMSMLISMATAFVPNAVVPERTTLRMSETSLDSSILSLTLSKPLGMILEEVEEGEAKGVFVKEVGDAGSAAEYTEQVVGKVLATVQGQDTTQLGFDDVMDLIINAPESVNLEFSGESSSSAPSFEVGTDVVIKVQQSGGSDIEISAKVGDNLRKTLQDNKVEVYQGMKQKLGNCGGGGQCTFCAFDFVESTGWEERSDYEDQKLAKNPDARLACLNNIQGPAVIRKADR